MSVTDLTEEMLLDSPTDETEGTLMYVNARGPEKPLDQKVRNQNMDAKANFLKKTHKAVSMIECEKDEQSFSDN
ncbi:unnamed protein product [Nippostrongylus brasiliensis]|uniref:Uncharacterized protein n=1 Tax=Nippostrongylus brasiliensis TaxID=27835 RepID=A0A0N4YTS9_NIPBR|nr:unnamed protein product [Nippostrongylus brasiliensis]